MRIFGRHQLVMLSVVPFLLLSASQSVRVRTTVYLDGTVQREVVATYLSDRRPHVLPELNRALPQADQRRERVAGEGLRAIWSVILGRPQQLPAVLQTTEIVDQPLSLFTTYRWTETLEIASETATAVEKADPGRASFDYEITMPGWVRSAQAVPQAHAPVAELTTVPAVSHAPALSYSTAPPPTMALSPVQAQIAGSVARFTLSAAHGAYEVNVESRRLRWGYLILILYVLGFVAYRITAFAVHRSRMRPRRI